MPAPQAYYPPPNTHRPPPTAPHVAASSFACAGLGAQPRNPCLLGGSTYHQQIPACKLKHFAGDGLMGGEALAVGFGHEMAQRVLQRPQHIEVLSAAVAIFRERARVAKAGGAWGARQPQHAGASRRTQVGTGGAKGAAVGTGGAKGGHGWGSGGAREGHG